MHYLSEIIGLKYYTQNKVSKTLCAQQLQPHSFLLQAGKLGSQFNKPEFCPSRGYLAISGDRFG